MRPVAFLFDEHVTRTFEEPLRRRVPGVGLYRVGHEPAPPVQASDPENLLWCEEHHAILVTMDHATLPTHFGDHLAAGHRCWGLLVLNPQSAFASCLDDLVTVAGASVAEDWLDTLRYLPL